jgi:DNA-binding GntR family transcriptional regulator
MQNVVAPNRCVKRPQILFRGISRNLMPVTPTQLALNVARVSLADSVYETLLEAILSGQLSTGVELNAVSLATQLQVSRTPVQEAIRRLENDGLVVNPLGRKARVARFTRDDAREVYEMRMVLESAAAALAARKISAAALASLKRETAELAATKEAPDWPVRALEYDARFHRAIAEAAGNARLRDDIARYRLLVRGFCRMTGSLVNLRAAFSEHRQILKAIAARDAERASGAMRRHIERRMQTALDTLG